MDRRGTAGRYYFTLTERYTAEVFLTRRRHAETVSSVVWAEANGANPCTGGGSATLERIPPVSQRLFVSLLALVCSMFVLSGSAGISRSGIQTDEALFSAAIYPPFRSDLRIEIFERDYSLMVMPYVGSLKGYLWGPVLKIWGPSAATVRIPALLLGAASIWMFGLLVRRLLGTWPALGASALLATDPMYLMTTRWDWGPVAIQHVCLTGAMFGFIHYVQTSRRASLWAASILCGLGVWDKVTFIWVLSGIALAALPWWRPKRREAAVFLAGLFLGALPFVLYNVRSRGGTLTASEGWTATELDRKASLLKDVLQGAGLHGIVAREFGEHKRDTGFLWLLIVFAALAFRRAATRRVGAFALGAGFIAWCWMAFSKGGGAGTHHVILLWPFPQLAVAAGMAALPLRVAMPVVLLVATSQAYSGVTYLQYEATLGSRAAWSEASYGLASALSAAKPARVCLIDWGFFDTLRLLGEGRFDLCAADPPSPLALLQNEANVYVTHTAGEEILAGSNKRFLADAASQGFFPSSRRILPDRHGRPVIEIFHLRHGRFDRPIQGSEGTLTRRVEQLR